MKKFLPIFLLLLTYLIFTAGSATFYSFQDGAERQRNIQEYLNNIKDEKQRAVVAEGIRIGTHPTPGFSSSYCHEGLGSIIFSTIINFILLAVISVIITIPILFISILFRQKIPITYQQKVIIVGILSLIAFELLVNLFALGQNIRSSYQLVFLYGCL